MVFLSLRRSIHRLLHQGREGTGPGIHQFHGLRHRPSQGRIGGHVGQLLLPQIHILACQQFHIRRVGHDDPFDPNPFVNAILLRLHKKDITSLQCSILRSITAQYGCKNGED